MRDSFPDPRAIPNYGIPEAAHYLRMPVTTLRAWLIGQDYQTMRGTKRFRPIIKLAQRKPPLLSFINLVEAHVLDAIRHEHGVPLQTVRRALDYVIREFGIEHPLARQQFETDGVNLFIQRLYQLIHVSEEGQLAIRELLAIHLRRIEHDEVGLALRLFPFTRPSHLDQPKTIVIDPHMSFGRPVLSGTGIATIMIAERYAAGDSIALLADDYGRDSSEIEEAVRCELRLETV
jgi:uncharacterized protein (DUF433 family)